MLRHCFKKKEQSFSYGIRHNTDIYRLLKICFCNFWNADFIKCTDSYTRSKLLFLIILSWRLEYLILVTFRYIWTERFISFTGVYYCHSAVQKVTPMNRHLNTKTKRNDDNKKDEDIIPTVDNMWVRFFVSILRFKNYKKKRKITCFLSSN